MDYAREDRDEQHRQTSASHKRPIPFGTSQLSMSDVEQQALGCHDDPDDSQNLLPPPHLSSSSSASSMASGSPRPAPPSPSRLGLSRSTLRDDSLDAQHFDLDAREAREEALRRKHVLAKRLVGLAQRLAESEDADHAALATQMDDLEMTIAPNNPSQQIIPPSPPSRPHSSPLSLSILKETLPAPPAYEETEEEMIQEKVPAQKAKRIVTEAAKLNEELNNVVANLQARQEESDHIHGLLIERAERAAQRIIFLQSRVSYLEDELRQNDDELQHLRICLKAVEVQMPPHPDAELQRCIAVFKEDLYAALRKKRADTAAGMGTEVSLLSASSFEGPKAA